MEDFDLLVFWSRCVDTLKNFIFVYFHHKCFMVYSSLVEKHVSIKISSIFFIWKLFETSFKEFDMLWFLSLLWYIIWWKVFLLFRLYSWFSLTDFFYIYVKMLKYVFIVYEYFMNIIAFDSGFAVFLFLYYEFYDCCSYARKHMVIQLTV